MKWITDNWSLLVVLAIFIVYLLLCGKRSVKEWLLYAVSMAEKAFGDGTGKLKLKVVYNAFVAEYPIFSKLVPFEMFSGWVDEALAEMRKLIETNLDIKAAIKLRDK